MATGAAPQLSLGANERVVLPVALRRLR